HAMAQTIAQVQRSVAPQGVPTLQGQKAAADSYHQEVPPDSLKMARPRCLAFCRHSKSLTDDALQIAPAEHLAKHAELEPYVPREISQKGRALHPVGQRKNSLETHPQ